MKCNSEVSPELREAVKGLDFQERDKFNNIFRAWTDIPSDLIQAEHYKTALEKIRDYNGKFISIGILQSIAREALR